MSSSGRAERVLLNPSGLGAWDLRVRACVSSKRDDGTYPTNMMYAYVATELFVIGDFQE